MDPKTKRNIKILSITFFGLLCIGSIIALVFYMQRGVQKPVSEDSEPQPISNKIPFLNKPGYYFAQRIIPQYQLKFDDQGTYYQKIFKAPADGIISGIVLKGKSTPFNETPSFLTSTMTGGPEYQTTIIENNTNNTILYSDILTFKNNNSISDQFVTVKKDDIIYLQKNNVFDGSLSEVEVDVYYSENVHSTNSFPYILKFSL